MEKDDVRLIHAILDGDNAAFDILVQKYQKRVHALAWRKIGDSTMLKKLRRTPFSKSTKNSQPSRIPSSLPDGCMSLPIELVLVGSEKGDLRCNRWKTRLWKK